ncbi:hypothetical protein [uncultured Christiangramia sp.]|uniref:hypothetical protein n=1 Tax=uncultured Christiangramia sp. TaxID=503836 RepID=UPI00261776E2|nr:hypothetical protein [uncultured Christiangramia sp.]
MEFGNWKIGRIESVVVSDKKVKNTNFPIPPNPSESREVEKQYYGGYLICESIANSIDAKLIAAAPKMYEALKSIENDNGNIPEAIWKLRNEAIKEIEK